MKYFLVFLTAIILYGCGEPQMPIDLHEEDWASRRATLSPGDSLEHGKSYLSVYSEIYSFSKNQKFSLTGLVSLRNVSEKDTIYLLHADYYNTIGDNIRTYFDFPIYVKPMETLEIVIAQEDVHGGSGSNFLIEWSIPPNCPEPLFEGVMNSMQNTQGISFTTHARRIE